MALDPPSPRLWRGMGRGKEIMGKMSKRKGAAGEREAAEKLNDVLGTRFHRGRQYHGGPESPDLAGDLPGLHVEVKRCERLRLYEALRQARQDASVTQVPAVMHRMNGKPWVIVVDVEDLIGLLDVVDACRARLSPVSGTEEVVSTVEEKGSSDGVPSGCATGLCRDKQVSSLGDNHGMSSVPIP